VKVDELIKAVKKKEVRQQGKPSQARRRFQTQEWEQAIHMLQQFEDPNLK
jgi:hypothetical protein